MAFLGRHHSTQTVGRYNLFQMSHSVQARMRHFNSVNSYDRNASGERTPDGGRWDGGTRLRPQGRPNAMDRIPRPPHRARPRSATAKGRLAACGLVPPNSNTTPMVKPAGAARAPELATFNEHMSVHCEGCWTHHHSLRPCIVTLRLNEGLSAISGC